MNPSGLGRVRARRLIGFAISTVLAGAAIRAQAQEVTPPPPADTPVVQEVVVPGPRIPRPDLTSDSPTVSVSADTMKNTSEISIDQELLKMPQFVAGANQLTSAGDVQATPTDSPGIATANLRGLGANRTLVLLDGRRTQPANATMEIDLNTIPQAALDSV